MSLISPGVSVTVTNESFFIPTASATVPLIFIATRSGKTQTDGVTPAAGTLEHSVVRSITSLTQSLQLYGVPYFHNDISGNEYHGDARNEYGLLALNNFLNAGNSAYVVRANVNLDDSPETFLSLGTPVLSTSSVVYNGVGNGTISGVSAANATVKPQTISVVFTTSSTFSVTGSKIGYIGTGTVGVPFNSTQVSFTVHVGSTLFSTGDFFTFQLVYAAAADSTNTGNGEVSSLIADTLAVAETVTITFTSATSYTVVGSITGASSVGVIGSPYDNNRLNFTVLAGTVPFIAGDSFDIVIQSVTISSSLGANDAARRVAITTALQAEINSNVDVRSELFEYNLICCPGYPEVVDELLALNIAIKEEAFVIAPTPGNKTPEQVASWAMTSERFNSTNVAYYYPWCLMSNIDGRNVLGDPVAAMLATYAYNDQAAYVWEAPAGVNRGALIGVSKVGYFTGTPGTATTFVEVSLNDGQRDNLYQYYTNMNPLVYFPGRGLLCWGQKTSAGAASALDRVNVVRLVVYLRRAMRKGSLPYVFEPSDKITWDNLKGSLEGILTHVMGLRGLYDFAVICDATTNTADEIDNNNLIADVAIKPTRAAEFVYVRMRVVKTSASI